MSTKNKNGFGLCPDEEPTPPAPRIGFIIAADIDEQTILIRLPPEDIRGVVLGSEVTIREKQ